MGVVTVHLDVKWQGDDGWAGEGGGQAGASFPAPGPVDISAHPDHAGWVALRLGWDGAYWFPLWGHAGWYRRSVIRSWNASYGLDEEGRDSDGELSPWRWANQRRKGNVRAVRILAAVWPK